MILLIVALYISQAQTITLEDVISSVAQIPEDGRLQFCELAKERGFECVPYYVPTEDGYILGVFRIRGDSRKPVYLQHGFIDSSDAFIIANESIVSHLVDNNYDIWLGNMRGNKYSKNHTKLSPSDIRFWDFTFHDVGIYDVAATIDFILKITGQEKLQVIGHSLGTTVTLVLLSTRPEYNDKIKSVICLAPIAYFRHLSSPITSLASVIDKTGISSELRGEFLGNSSVLVSVLRAGCSQGFISYEICSNGFFFPVFGYDPAQFSPELMREILRHYPSGTSFKLAVHTLQLVTGNEFANFNYGYSKNLLIYKSANPPVYDLSKITVQIVLIVGLNDNLSDEEDVKTLRDQLKNVDYYEIEYKLWNHIDFLFGRFMPKYLFDTLDKVLKKYN